MLKLRIQFAEKCAWRALYIFRPVDIETGWNRASDQQIARIGFDPGNGPRASIFFAVGNKQFRIKLPRWRHWWRFDGRNPLYSSYDGARVRWL